MQLLRYASPLGQAILSGHIPQTIRLVCHVVIRFTSLILIASYTTSAMMSSAMTMTRWPVAKGGTRPHAHARRHQYGAYKF